MLPTYPRSQTVTLTLPTPPAFDLQATVRSHGGSHLAPFRWDSEQRVLLRTEQLPSGRVVLLEVRQRPSDEALQVEVRANGPFDAADMAELESRAARTLRLEEDLSGFQALWDGADPPPFLFPRSGGRMLRAPTLWEEAVKVIATTNVNWRQTVAMTDRLVAELGAPFPGEPSLHAFPSPELVAANETLLTERVRMGYRNSSVLELARAIAEKRLDLESYWNAALPAAELRRELKRLRGIGDYAAACLLMALGRYDYLPIDSEAHGHVSRAYFGGEAVTPRQIDAIYERWGPWRYLVYWFDMARREDES